MVEIKAKDKLDELLSDIEKIPLSLFIRNKHRGIFFVLCGEQAFSVRMVKDKLVIKRANKEEIIIAIFSPNDDLYCKAVVLYEKIAKHAR